MINKRINKKSVRAVFIALGSALLWIIVWEIAALIVNNSLILPSPLLTGARLFVLACHCEFWRAVAFSILGISAGFLSGAAVGAAGGVLCGYYAVPRALFSPVLTVVRSTPVASFIMLAYIWFSKSTLPGFISFLMVFPVVWGAVERGIAERDRKLAEAARIFNFNRRKMLKYVTIPSIRPYFTESLRTSAGLAWKAGIAAEVLVFARNTIGGKLYEAKTSLESADVFAWTLCVVIISLALEAIIKAILGKNETREEKEEKI